MEKKIFSAALVLMFLIPMSVYAGLPMDTAKAGVDKVVSVAADKSLELSVKKEKIRAIVGEFFDFTVLGRLTLGRYWKAFKPDQQKEFIKLYRTLLENVYMERILAYTNEKVVFEKEIMHSDKKAEVESNIVTSTAQIPIPGGYAREGTIATFIGFGPVPDPEMVILVKLDRPNTSPWASQTSAASFARLASRLFVVLGVPPDGGSMLAEVAQ